MTVDQHRAVQRQQPGQKRRQPGQGRQPGRGSGPAGRPLPAAAEDGAGGEVLVQLPRAARGPQLTKTAMASQLYRASAASRQHMEQTVLRRVRLSWTAFAVLRQASAGDAVESRVVAAETGIAKGTLTGVVDMLAQRGLVRRRAHPKDGRLVLIEATRAGRHLVARVMPAVHAEEAFVLRGLSDKQIDQFGGVLLQLIQHLDSDEGRVRRR
jgi:MarR family transcriptional regulator, organic hydroperoxide resistance regulator